MFKRWPPCTLEPGAPLSLAWAYIHHAQPLSDRVTKAHGPLTAACMVFVTLEKNEIFEKVNNVIPLLKDRTVSVLTSQVFGIYINNTPGAKETWEETRLLLTYLLFDTNSEDYNRYIEEYDRAGTLEMFKDYLVLRVVPKEKELKEIYRGFGCHHHKDRMRTWVQENSSAGFLDKYSDEQAMTLSEIDLLKKLSSFRNLHKAYVGNKILNIVIDASSWNNHFRRETVDVPMTETLDRIYGTSIFGKTHQAFLS